MAIKSEINDNVFGFSGQSVNWQWGGEGLPLWCAADVPPVRSSFIYVCVEFTNVFKFEELIFSTHNSK